MDRSRQSVIVCVDSDFFALLLDIEPIAWCVANKVEWIIEQCAYRNSSTRETKVNQVVTAFECQLAV